MHLLHWLQNFRALRQQPRGHRDSRGHRATSVISAERLEERTLLSANVLFVTGELNIALESSDAVRVGPFGTNVLVEVGNDGGQFRPSTSLGVVPAASVQKIVVDGGDQENMIDLSRVLKSNFPNLTTIEVRGRNGEDTIIGSADIASQLFGGDGIDTIIGGSANDSLDGGDGADSINAGAGNDSILGGDGADLISGDDGNDSIDGGNGQDTINGGAGDDNVYAGNGNDSIFGDAGNDTLNGDGGTDTVDGGVGNDSILGGELGDSLLGGDGNDTLDGQGGNDRIDGQIGEDNVRGGAGNDSISGSLGNDILSGEAGNDTISGGDGSDTLFGGSGLDSLLGDTGDDVVKGQAGNDTLDGGGGADIVDGGDGDDLVRSVIISVTDTLPIISIDDGNVGEGSPALPFNVATSYPVGGSGAFESITANDFNGDGFVDTAIAVSSGVVRLMLNDGTGVFTPGAVMTVGNFPLGITSGDFDGDGRNDIAVSNASDSTISVLRNAGNGTFAAAVTLSLANFSFPRGIIAEDVTGDGRLDLITANAVGNNVSVFIGNVSGGFGTRRDYAAGNGATDVVAVDLNGDGQKDLAVAATNANQVTALINNGGSFTTSTRTNVGQRPVTITALDIDNDGDQDVAVGCAGNDEITILQNNGSANFTIATRLTTSGSIGDFNIVALDVDGDTNIDLAVGNRNVFNEANVFLNLGSGTFVGRQDLNFPNPGDTGGPIAARDVNGDGSPDLLVAGIVDDLLHVLINPNPPFNVQTATLTISLSQPSVLPVTVNYASTDGSATGGTDYVRINGTLTFAPGQTSQTISVRSRRDVLIEPTENFFVNLTVPTNAVIGDGQSHILIVDGNGGIPGPTMTISDATVVEGNGTLTTVMLTVTLSAPSTQTITVDYATLNGTASSGSDYVSVTGQLTFDPGVVNQTIAVTIIGDSSPETDEVFSINLSNPTNIVLSDSRSDITITNDDAANSGTATLLGGAGNDTMVGSNLDELFNGGVGNDLISAGGGNDLLVGGAGNDTLNGQDGNDTLNGQAGNDSLDGGLGNDTFIWQGATQGRDTAIGGTGFDVMVVNGNGTANAFVVSANLGRLQIGEGAGYIVADNDLRNVIVNGGNGKDTFSFGGNLTGIPGTRLDLNGDGGDDTFLGTRINLGIVRVAMNGGAGNDTMFGTLSNDTMFGGDGDDNLAGGNGNDIVDGGLGDDIITGQLGNDSLTGGEGNDLLSGDEGSDSLVGGIGADTLNGGDDDDTLRGNDGDDVLNGMAGNDSLEGSFGRDALVGGDGNDTLDGGHDDDTLSGQVGNDLIRGDHGNDWIDGGDGNDTINGNDGNDTIDGGLGNDLINGADGDDSINGNEGADIIVGGDGNDVLIGGADADIILGEDGQDTINGQLGPDTVAGNQGTDVISDAASQINERFTLSAVIQQALQGL